jgi:hypothetical protein
MFKFPNYISPNGDWAERIFGVPLSSDSLLHLFIDDALPKHRRRLSESQEVVWPRGTQSSL